MTACRIYPFARENAKLFSQELIENVLKDFGHFWIPQRSKREKLLREVAVYVFTPAIGKLVSHFSRKHGGFVIMASYNTWNYIKSHRDCVLEQMVCNAIASLCKRCDLESDDLGLFIFMAIVVEYARFVIVDGKEHLVEGIVNALSYCLTDIIPGGFIETLYRMQYRASNLELPETHLVSDYDSERSFISPISTDTLNTPRSEFESPLDLSLDIPAGTQYSTPMEDIEVEFKKRELHREFFKRQFKVTSSVETSVGDTTPYLSYSDRIRSNSREVLGTEDKKIEGSNEYSVGVNSKLKETCDQKRMEKDGNSSEVEAPNCKIPNIPYHVTSASDKLQSESLEVNMTNKFGADLVVEVTQSFSETSISDKGIEKASEELKDNFVEKSDNYDNIKIPVVEQLDAKLQFVNVEEKSCDDISSKDYYCNKDIEKNIDELIKSCRNNI